MTVADVWRRFDIEFDELVVAWRRLRPEVGPGDPGLDFVLAKKIRLAAEKAAAQLDLVTG